MASADTIMGVMFALSGIVIAVGLVVHYARESRTKPARPRSTLSGVIQLLMIFIGLMVAIAVIDFVAMSIGGGTPGAMAPVQWR